MHFILFSICCFPHTSYGGALSSAPICVFRWAEQAVSPYFLAYCHFLSHTVYYRMAIFMGLIFRGLVQKGLYPDHTLLQRHRQGYKSHVPREVVHAQELVVPRGTLTQVSCTPWYIPLELVVPRGSPARVSCTSQNGYRSSLAKNGRGRVLACSTKKLTSTRISSTF